MSQILSVLHTSEFGKIDYRVWLIAVVVTILIVLQMHRRIKFNQGILYHSTIILKHKKYRAFSLAGIILGVLCILSQIWIGDNQDRSVNFYIGFFNGVLIITGAIFSPLNYTAISKAGIQVHNRQIKWSKISKISKSDFSFIITVKNTNYYIDYANLKDIDEFRNAFIEAIKNFKQFDLDRMKL